MIRPIHSCDKGLLSITCTDIQIEIDIFHSVSGNIHGSRVDRRSVQKHFHGYIRISKISVPTVDSEIHIHTLILQHLVRCYLNPGDRKIVVSLNPDCIQGHRSIGRIALTAVVFGSGSRTRCCPTHKGIIGSCRLNRGDRKRLSNGLCLRGRCSATAVGVVGHREDGLLPYCI